MRLQLADTMNTIRHQTNYHVRTDETCVKIIPILERDVSKNYNNKKSFTTIHLTSSHTYRPFQLVDCRFRFVFVFCYSHTYTLAFVLQLVKCPTLTSFLLLSLFLSLAMARSLSLTHFLDIAQLKWTYFFLNVSNNQYYRERMKKNNTKAFE